MPGSVLIPATPPGPVSPKPPACRSILVVCEGNHCRSPIAQALLTRALAPDVRVASAGLAAVEGVPAHPEVKRLMDALSLDLSSHRSRQVTPAMALDADLVLVMDRGQESWMGALVPAARGRIFLLGHWVSPVQEIPDPFLRGGSAFAETLTSITQCVAGWIPHLVLQ